ncbi:MAG: type IV pilus assembly protein PilM [Bdellovibrionales bacterium]
MFWGSKKVLGLDIGTSTIKMAEVDVGRSGATLTAFAMTATPSGAVAAGDILDPGAVAQAVAGLFQELRSKRKQVAVGLWGSSVIVKKISIPRMEEKVVGEQIRWEAEQYIPFDINEVNLAFKILKGLPQNAETMDILIIAARQEQAFKYAEIVQSAGLQCTILDVGGFALANCFEANYGVMPGEAVALLNIGASVTNLVVVESGEVVFCRDVPVGGLTHTGEIQKALSISSEEAESMKLSACIGQEAPEEVPNILRAANEIVSDEIQGSFDFFMNTNANTALKRCYVTGGGARVPGLIEHMSKALNIPCEPMNAMNRVNGGKSLSPGYLADVADFLAVSLGLGLRKQDD